VTRKARGGVGPSASRTTEPYPARDTEGEAFAATRLVPPPLSPLPFSLEAEGALDETQPEVAPALFDLPDGAAMAIRPGPLLLVRLGGDPMDGFAGRLEALRAVSGGAVSQGLACGTRAGEEGGVLGGTRNPFVQMVGQSDVVFGARASHTLALVPVRGIAFLREDILFGFETRLAHELGPSALHPSVDPVHASSDEATSNTGAVQLRGKGFAVIELAGDLMCLPSAPERPLLVERDWVVGWLGRLVVRVPARGERGLIKETFVRFSGRGTVLVCGQQETQYR